MSVLVSGTRSPRPIFNAQTRTNAGADGAVLDAMAGHIHLMAQVVNGTAVNAYGNQPVLLPSPLRGWLEPGHDHSGGMAGVPQKHTVWQHTYGWVAGTAIDYNEAPRVSAGGEPRIIDSAIPVWVPPGRIYRALLPQCVIRCVNDGGNFTLTARNGEAVVTKSVTGVGAGTTVITADDLLAIRPGRFNRITWTVVGDVLNLGAVAYLLQLSLHQIYDVVEPVTTA
jgi:hypothetical protein